MSPHRRKVLLRSLAIAVGGGICLLMLGFGLFRSDPSWYRRVHLTEAQQAEGQQRLLDRIATLRNDVGRTQAAVVAEPKKNQQWPSFDIELSEDEVNGVVMRWRDTEPHLRDALRHIDEPHLRFLDNRIEFAGRVSGSLASIELSVRQTDEGPRITLGRPWAGRLPLPRSLMDEAGSAVVIALRDSGPGVPNGLAEAVAGLIAGDEVTPIVPIPSSVEGKQVLAAKVEKLVISDGKLKATLRPVE